MSLQWPMMLWLLVPVLAGAGLMWWRRPGPGVLTRALMFALLVLAAAEPVLNQGVSGETVVFAVDTSSSIPEAEQSRALADARARLALLSDTDRAGLVTFGSSPTIHAVPGQQWPEVSPGSSDRTDIAAGLEAAAGLLPRQSPGRIVLYTDGHSDTGLDAILSTLSARSIAVEVEPLSPEQSGPVVTDIALDSRRPAPGETLSGALTLHGGEAGFTGDITLSLGDRELPAVAAEIAPGASVTLPLSLSLPGDLPAGGTTLTATVAGTPTAAALSVNAPARIAIASSRPQAGAHLAALLTAEGFSPTRLTPADLAGPIEADLLVLVDLPASRIPAAFDDTVESFVREGGSLLTLGGDQSYDLGGWHQRRFVELLPLTIDPDGALKDDAVTLVIALDKSGSMAQSAVRSTTEAQLVQGIGDRMVGGRPTGSKIRLAAEGAVSALNLLRDTDRIGVLSVDTQARWHVAVQSVASKEPLRRRIRSISSGGGGIYTVTALENAREGLLSSDTPLRHLILFADTSDAGEQYRGSRSASGIVEQLAEDGVTLSVIGIGSRTAQDAEFLMGLARRGGGRFHATDDPEQLPALFAQETEELLGSAIEESPDLRISTEQWHPILAGIDIDTAPALTGINRVQPQPSAQLVLTTGGGSPLLSTWRVGLGEVASMTTDDGGRWASSWRSWDDGGRLWVQLVRSLVDTGTADTRISVDDSGRVTVTRYGPDGLSLPRPAVFAGTDDAPAPLSLTATIPGTWQGQLPAGDGPWRIEALDADGSPLARQSHAPAPGHEHTHRAPDTARLDALSQAAEQTAVSRTETRPLWPLVLLIAALLLPVDAYARRRTR